MFIQPFKRAWQKHRPEYLARILLTFGAALPYWRLLTFKVLYVTDDRIGSDIFTGELPFRFHVGRLLTTGKVPLWSSAIGSGTPIISAEPISTLAFAFLPLPVALDGWILFLLLVAAHGTYGLARRFGSDRTSSVLAGIAFAGSGYMTCQLKHTSIIATVAWLPYGLLILDRFFAFRDSLPLGFSKIQKRKFIYSRILWATLFGILVVEQLLPGFVQSAYYCFLVYIAFGLFRLRSEWKAEKNFWVCGTALLILTIAGALGVVGGTATLLPLRAMGQVSDRASGMGWTWATMLAYSPQDFVTFLFPYANGDISDHTYLLPSLFWEDYGYVGIATFLLAIYGGIVERLRPQVLFLLCMTVLAYLIVLGPATPVYHLIWTWLPGMNFFRFPTRFLVVVDLGICLLAAVGLTHLRSVVRSRSSGGLSDAVAVGICTLTALDLFIHQPRQNPMVSAKEWLAPPPAVALIQKDNPSARTYLPLRIGFHAGAYSAAKGWSDLRPYYYLRDSLEPNTGLYWGVASADMYSGIAPKWQVDVWGDHNRQGFLIGTLTEFQTVPLRIVAKPAFAKLLSAYGVTHVTAPVPIQGPGLTPLGPAGYTNVYRVEGASRVRIVNSSITIPGSQQAAAYMIGSHFDPMKTVVLKTSQNKSFSRESSKNEPPGTALITKDSGEQLTIECEARTDAYLVLADTFFPGWEATVDGVNTPIYQANISTRAVSISPGRHQVTFSFHPRQFYVGASLSLLAISTLLGGLAFSFFARKNFNDAKQN